jgi:hypothetical protein
VNAMLSSQFCEKAGVWQALTPLQQSIILKMKSQEKSIGLSAVWFDSLIIICGLATCYRVTLSAHPLARRSEASAGRTKRLRSEGR